MKWYIEEIPGPHMNPNTITVLGCLLAGVWMGELALILWSYRVSTGPGCLTIRTRGSDL